MQEQKSQGRSRLKLAFFCVVGIHVAALMVALLSQGCKREQTPPPDVTIPPIIDTNLPVLDTNLPPPEISTAAPPVMVEPPVAPPPVVASTQEHVIAKGDTYSDLAKKYGVSVKAIEAANPGVDPKKLKLGQKINIPAPSATTSAVAVASESGEQTYTVKSGDNLTKIAAEHHTTVKAIQTANNMTDTRIKVGQKLKIPGKAAVPVIEAAPAPAPVTAPK